MFGAELVAEAPRLYSGKSKNAQEAHEAIRPAGDVFKTPAELASVLYGRALELYDLIWKRTVASQMQDARVSTTTAKIVAEPLVGASAGKSAEFTASGTVVTFRGFLAAYEESADEARNDEGDSKEAKLPQLAVGQLLNLVEVNATSHQTSPPPRYTEASLVKALEEDGIGRPSTYAAIISNIIGKGYVIRRGQALVPEWIAFSLIRYLEENFGYLVQYEFTAQMEADLDRIADGELDSTQWLKDFFFGTDTPKDPGLHFIAENVADGDPRAINTINIAEGIDLRTGKFGAYLEVQGDPSAEGFDENGRRIVNIPEGLAPDELTPAKAQELIDAPVITDRELGIDPETGHPILLKDGRFGSYVLLNDPAAVKPKTGSLFATMNAGTITFEEALKLLSLPRTIGEDPETKVAITAQNGKFGPYITRGKESRSLTGEDQIFEISLDEALALLAQPKARGRQTAATPLREFGEDPASKLAVVAKTGQFGNYVTDGVINATVPKEEPLDELSPDRAFELLAIRREKLGLEPGEPAPKAGRSTGRAAAKKVAPARTVKRGSTRK